MKTCNHENCTYPQFGGGYCKIHQTRRNDKKAPRGLRKVSKTNKVRPKKETRSLLRTKDADLSFYAEIWEERAHVDFETGEIIPAPSTVTFHHVLEKENYEEFRYMKWNIVLLGNDTHQIAHRDLDKLPKLKAYREHLIKTYL